MSDDENVWSPGDEGAARRVPRPPGTAYGEGLWINQAFSLDVAFRIGLALLRERPGLLFGVGAAAWFLANLPNLLSVPGGMVSGFLDAGGDVEAAAVVDALNSLVGIGLSIVLFPFQWFVMTGGLRAVARYVESDDTDPSITWSSWLPTAWVVLYRILVTFIVVSLLLAVLAPVVAVAAVLAWQGSVEASMAVAIVGSLVVVGVVVIGIALPLELGTLACAIDGMTPLQALPIAWRAAQGARATLLVFGLVFGVLLVLGICMCCVGQIPVYALVIGAAGGGWVLYSRPEEALQRSAFLRRNLPDLT